MPYPIVKDSEARAWWKDWALSEVPNSPPPAPEENVSPNGGDHNWPAIADELIQRLSELYCRVDRQPATTTKPGLMARMKGSSSPEEKLSNERFEARACVMIHQALPNDEALADPEFWIWLACRPGLELIRRKLKRNRSQTETTSLQAAHGKPSSIGSG